jgi:hypothetical protein
MWNSKTLFRRKVLNRLGLEIMLLDARNFALLNVHILDSCLDIDYIGVLGIQFLWFGINIFIAW